MDKFSNIQKLIFDNKLKNNTTNVELKFCFTNGERAEAFEAYRKKLPSAGEELAIENLYYNNRFWGKNRCTLKELKRKI